MLLNYFSIIYTKWWLNIIVYKIMIWTDPVLANIAQQCPENKRKRGTPPRDAKAMLELTTVVQH